MKQKYRQAQQKGLERAHISSRKWRHVSSRKWRHAPCNTPNLSARNRPRPKNDVVLRSMAPYHQITIHRNGEWETRASTHKSNPSIVLYLSRNTHISATNFRNNSPPYCKSRPTEPWTRSNSETLIPKKDELSNGETNRSTTDEYQIEKTPERMPASPSHPLQPACLRFLRFPACVLSATCGRLYIAPRTDYYATPSHLTPCPHSGGDQLRSLWRLPHFTPIHLRRQ